MSDFAKGSVKNAPIKNKPIKSDISKPSIEYILQEKLLVIKCFGLWNTHTVHFIDDELRTLEQTKCHKTIIDASQIVSLDTAGAFLLERTFYNFKNQNITIELHGIKENWQPLVESVSEIFLKDNSLPHYSKKSFLYRFFEFIGKNVTFMGVDFLLAMHVLGATIQGAQMKRSKKSRINLPAIVAQVDKMGVGAVPIIFLMSFIVGAIIAQQGAFQLRYFGAEIFVVDLVGILVFRELGVLLTAIMIAGRSGSAITAEIGSMKMREETDALTVMGLNPIGVLIFPRLVALAVVLPLLTIIADIAALLGAFTVANLYSNISYEAFMTRLVDAVWMTTYLAGLIKAPFMAFIIGIIASVEGLKVGGSAESLGKRVTSSVVKSIFVVIVVDGFFAIFYAAIQF